MSSLPTSHDACVHRLSLPTPYPVGRVNAYVLPGDPPSLVDCGVLSSRSLTELEEGLGRLGLRPEELGSLFLTHSHYDHAGAAAELGRRTGARVHYHAASPERPERSRSDFQEALRRYGAPEDLIALLDLMNRQGERFGEALEGAPARVLVTDGEMFQAGQLTLRALHTPGHNAGHLCYLAEEAGLIFCGDLLLPTITPNPLPHFDEAAPRGRRPSLELYLASVARVEALGPLRGYGGHGDPMPDTVAVARHAREAIARRQDTLRSLCEQHPGSTLFSLAERLFGEATGLGRVLAFTEVLAHCDVLEDRGEIEVDHAAGRLIRIRR